MTRRLVCVAQNLAYIRVYEEYMRIHELSGRTAIWHYASRRLWTAYRYFSQSVLTKYLSCSIYNCSNYRRGALRVLHRYVYLALKLRWLFIYIAGLLPLSSVFDVQVDSAADWRCGLVSISSLFNF